MAKTTFLQIRCSPEDRRVLLQAAERWEARRAPSLRVAEKEGAAYGVRSRPPKQGDKAAGPPKRPSSRKG
jgi:hypothetical protein